MNAYEWAKSLTETLLGEPPADDQIPDVVADLQAAEKTLAECRKMLMSEVSEPVAGTMFRIVESRSAKRSYNDSAILGAFWRGDVNTTLHYLMGEDAVRLAWRWTELRALAAKDDVMLSIAHHEVGDGDDALVGENWSSEFRVEAKK